MTTTESILSKPKHIDGAVQVAFSSDNNYAPYLSVAIASLVHNADPNRQYAIYILDGGISASNRSILEEMVAGNNHVTLQFIDMAPYMARHQESLFHVPEKSHFSKANYHRFFLPEIFRGFDKILYLDSDLVILDDVATLYNANIGEKSIGACRDYSVWILCDTYKFHRKYMIETLRLRNPQNYFNTGVMLCNIQKMAENGFTRKCIERLKEIVNPIFVDQCVINACAEDDTFLLNSKWNFMTNTVLFDKPLLFKLDKPRYDDVMASYTSPSIVHYASEAKPWHFKSSVSEHAQYWWHYAAITPFRDLLLGDLFRGMAESNPSKSAIDYKTEVCIPGFKTITLSGAGKKKIRLFGFIPLEVVSKVSDQNHEAGNFEKS